MTPWRPRLSDHSTIYLALADALQADVEAGRLPPGTQLPTHRVLAHSLGVDLTTVSRAYAEARRRGLIAGHVGRGTFVRAAARAAAPRGDEVDLRLNIPPEPAGLSPEALLARTLSGIAGGGQASGLLDYGPLFGAEPHRIAGAAWCQGLGIRAGAERVILSAGAQQAVAVVLGALCQPGDVICAEGVTYPGFLTLARQLRLRVVGVPMDAEGLDPDAFDRVCRRERARLAYLIPTLQNPTGRLLSNERRRRVAAVARKHGVTLLEDDVYGPLFEGKVRPLSAFAPELVYHVASLSKTVAPGLRIAYLVAPVQFDQERILGSLQATGWMASPLSAEVATRWIEDGTARRVTAARRAEGEARQEILHTAFPQLPRRRPPSGYHAWLSLPRRWRAEDLVRRLERNGVGVIGAAAFATGPEFAEEAIRVCLGGPRSRDALSEGLRLIANAMASDPALARPLV